MQAEFMTRLQVKADDESDCWITGLARISSDEILLADTYNCSIKVFDTNENSITSRYKSTDKPWDVAVIDSKNFVVTLPHTDKCLFLKRSNKELSESHRLKVKNGCYGVAYFNGVLAVSINWPPSVQIVDMQGLVLREITNIFNYPGGIHVCLSHDGREIFVTATNDNAMHVLTIDGRLKTTMKSEMLNSVRGITVSSRGTVFVCSDSIQEQSEKVCMLLPSIGKTIPVSVQDVLKPYCIIFDEEKKRLYISESCTTDGSSFIKVYNWKYTEHS